MLRKLSTLPWQNLSLLKLREELSIRGIHPSLTRDEMIQKLLQYEKNKEISAGIQNPSDLQSSQRYLPSPFIYKEIYKRLPGFEVKPDMDKKTLIATLNDLVVEERRSGPKDLRHLLTSFSSPEQLKIEDVFVVLSQIQDPSIISQFDFNILINTYQDSFVPLWEYLMNNLQKLTFYQVRLLTKSANTLQTFFKKQLLKNQPKLTPASLGKIIDRASELEKNEDCFMIAGLLSSLRSLGAADLQDFVKLQNRMIEKLEVSNLTDNMKLLDVLLNLPNGCYQLHKQSVDEILIKSEKLFSSLPIEELIKVLFNVYDTGSKVPFSLSVYLESSYADMRENNLANIYRLTKILIDQNLLSDCMASLLADNFYKLSLYDKEDCSKLIDYTYLLYEKNYFNLIIYKFKPFAKILNFDYPLDTSSLLKYGIIYWPHAYDPNDLTKVYLSVLAIEDSPQEQKSNLSLIANLQAILLEESKENPIYNHQFESTKNLDIDLRNRTIHSLHNILKSNDPSNFLVFKYFSDFQSSEIPENQDFCVDISQDNFEYMAKAIWRFKLGNETSSMVFKKAAQSIDLSIGNHTEALYYLTSANRDLASQINPSWVKLHAFTPALCYNLKTPVALSPDLLEIINEKIVLFGEPLLKSLIKISETCQNSQIFSLSSNLNFTPSCHPDPDSALVSEFCLKLQNHNKNIDFHACSSYLTSKLSLLEDSHIPILFNFFRNKWLSISPELQKLFETNLKNSDVFSIFSQGATIMSLQKIIEALKQQSVSYENLNILDTLIRYKIFNPNIITEFLNLISQENKAASTTIISKLLELFSNTGAHSGFFESLAQIIYEQDFWDSLSFDDNLNFFYAVKFFKHGKLKISANLEEKFKYDLMKIENLEVLEQHPRTMLNCYKPFLYKTELAPRCLVSNDAKLRQTLNDELIIEAEMPQNEISRQLKKYSLFVHYKIQPNDDIARAVKHYYKIKDRNSLIKSVKNEILDLVQQEFGHSFYQIPYDSQENEVLWKYDLGFNMSNLVFFIASNSDFCYNADGNPFDINPINRIIRFQLQEKGKIKVYPIMCDKWSKYSNEQKKEIVREVGLNAKTNP